MFLLVFPRVIRKNILVSEGRMNNTKIFCIYLTRSLGFQCKFECGSFSCMCDVVYTYCICLWVELVGFVRKTNAFASASHIT